MAEPIKAALFSDCAKFKHFEKRQTFSIYQAWRLIPMNAEVQLGTKNVDISLNFSLEMYLAWFFPASFASRCTPGEIPENEFFCG